jgi:hypothetical protein
LEQRKYKDIEICNFYCDESCHTKNDGNDFIVLASVYCRKSNLKLIKKDIKEIKERNQYNYDEELKWSNLRESNYKFYEEIIKYIHGTEMIKIRALIGNGKRNTFQPYEDWYHSMYFYMFKKVIEHFSYDFSCYRLFIDKKDTNSQQMYANTARYLKQKFKDKFDIEATAIDSKEHILVQIADVFAGAISYKKRELSSNLAKSSLINLICLLFETDLVTSSSLFSDFKFNLFSWTGGF